MFYVAEALLCEKGLRRLKKHSAVHSAFGEHYAKTGLLDPKFHGWLLDAFDDRLRADYDVVSVLRVDDVKVMIRQAQEFLDKARQYLSQSS